MIATNDDWQGDASAISDEAMLKRWHVCHGAQVYPVPRYHQVAEGRARMEEVRLGLFPGSPALVVAIHGSDKSFMGNWWSTMGKSWSIIWNVYPITSECQMSGWCWWCWLSGSLGWSSRLAWSPRPPQLAPGEWMMVCQYHGWCGIPINPQFYWLVGSTPMNYPKYQGKHKMFQTTN